MDLGTESLRAVVSTLCSLDGVTLVEGDIHELPFEDDSFDRVLCSSVTWYLSNPSRAIAEMVRVVKPGGRLVFDVRNPFHVTNALVLMSLWIKRNLRPGQGLTYTMFQPREIAEVLAPLPVRFYLEGAFVLLPTRLPVLGLRWGNWARLSRWLSFSAGKGMGLLLAQKLMVVAEKVS